MSMSIGGATVAVVQHKYGAMHCEAFKGKLEAVLQMIDRGDLGGGNGYGCDEHKAALHIIERQIAETRRGIAEQEANDTAYGVMGTPAPKPEPAGWRWKYGDTDHHKWVVADSPPPMMVKVFRLEPLFAAGVTEAPAPSWQAEAMARHAYERGANAMRDRAILVIEARHESGYDCIPWLLVKAIRDAEVPRDPCGVLGTLNDQQEKQR